MLRSCPLRVAPGHPGEATFFFDLAGDHPAASSNEDLARLDAVERAAASARDATRESADRGGFEPVLPSVRGFAAEPLSGRPASGEDLAAWFGPRDDWREVEEVQGELLSFFCGAATHVATRAKDARIRRGHGHLLRTGDRLLPGNGLATNTVWQRGAFGSHFTLGNTVFGRWSGVVRDELNLDPSTGLRIAVENGDAPGGFRVLGTATAFAMTPGTARWWYRLPGLERDGIRDGDAVLRVSLAAAAEGPLFAYAAEWISGVPRRLRVSCQVSPGPGENAAACNVTLLESGFAVRPADDNPLDKQGVAPGLLLRFADGAAERLGGDELLSGGERVGFPWLVAELAAAPEAAWTLELCNDVNSPLELPEEPAAPDAFWLDLARRAGFDPGVDPRTRRLAEVLPWLVHDAVLHLSTPVGLEQFTGGAWARATCARARWSCSPRWAGRTWSRRCSAASSRTNAEAKATASPRAAGRNGSCSRPTAASAPATPTATWWSGRSRPWPTTSAPSAKPRCSTRRSPGPTTRRRPRCGLTWRRRSTTSSSTACPAPR